jgi:glycosyltransferase involved in cell wall biosynthesis
MEDRHQIRTLYLLPEPGTQGGMTAITKMYYETGLFSKQGFRHFNTSFKTQNKFLRSLEGVIMKLRFVLVLMRFKPKVVIVMTSSHLGFYDKCLYCFTAGLFGIKTILNPVGGEFMNFFEKKRWSKILVKTMIRSASAIVIGSNYWYEYFKLNFGLSCKIYKIPNPVNSNSFERGNAGYLIDGKLHVITVGNVVKSKGILELADVIKKTLAMNTNIEFDIIGSGDLDEWLSAELANEIRLGSVNLRGRVSDEEKTACLLKSDLFLSLSHFEVIPIAMLEAMSASLPVISTDVGGIPDLIVNEENGFLLSRNNLTEVPLILHSLQSRTPNSLKIMGEKSRLIVGKEYDVFSVLNSYKNLSIHLMAG